jgi:hypothetical protein
LGDAGGELVGATQAQPAGWVITVDADLPTNARVRAAVANDARARHRLERVSREPTEVIVDSRSTAAAAGTDR